MLMVPLYSFSLKYHALLFVHGSENAEGLYSEMEINHSESSQNSLYLNIQIFSHF